MIIIGGKNSSNTKKLFKIASQYVITKHIEVKEELKKEWFNEKSIVGISAGASTPQWIINSVYETILNMFRS